MSRCAGAGVLANGCRKRCCEVVPNKLAAVSPNTSPMPANGGAQPHRVNNMRPCYKVASVTLCKKASLNVLGIGKGCGGCLQKGQADQLYGGRSRGDPCTGHVCVYIYAHWWYNTAANPSVCMFACLCVCSWARVLVYMSVFRVWCMCVTRVLMDRCICRMRPLWSLTTPFEQVNAQTRSARFLTSSAFKRRNGNGGSCSASVRGNARILLAVQRITPGGPTLPAHGGKLEVTRHSAAHARC